jgi:hypothetical protein
LDALKKLASKDLEEALATVGAPRKKKYRVTLDGPAMEITKPAPRGPCTPGQPCMHRDEDADQVIDPKMMQAMRYLHDQRKEHEQAAREVSEIGSTEAEWEDTTARNIPVEQREEESVERLEMPVEYQEACELMTRLKKEKSAGQGSDAQRRAEIQKAVDRSTRALLNIHQDVMRQVGLNVDTSPSSDGRPGDDDEGDQVELSDPEQSPAEDATSTGGPGSDSVRGGVIPAIPEELTEETPEVPVVSEARSATREEEEEELRESKKDILAKLRAERTRIQELQEEMAVFEKDLQIAEQLVISEGVGMEDLLQLTGEQRRERWRKNNAIAAAKEAREAEGNTASNVTVRAEVVRGPCCSGTGGVTKCGAKKCKGGHQGGKRKPCMGQGAITLNMQQMRSLTEAEIRDMCEKQRLRDVVVAEELSKTKQEQWQQELQERARKAKASVNDEPETSCVRGARAYLPTRR